MNKSLLNYLTYKTENHWHSIDAHIQDWAGSISLSLVLWNTANISIVIIYIESPPRVPVMKAQNSLTRRWLWCSGWGKEHVSVVFTHKRSRFIWKQYLGMKVNILWLVVGFLNVTMNRKPQNTEPEIGTDKSTQTQQTWLFDGYGSGFGLHTCSVPGFWMVL